ncbi:MAG: hypothetical protein Q4G23_04560 [Clostridia bacterium]|nr:hypothetical protein [Clostridia bacterium]
MSYATNSAMGTEAMLWGGIVILLYLVIFGIAIVSYILSSLAYYKIAKRRGIANAWLSWIPVANSWIIGRIANEYDRRNGHDRPWHKALLTLCITGAAGFAVSYGMFLVNIFKMAMNFDYSYYDVDVTSFLISYIGIIVFAVVISVYSMLSVICTYKTFESTVPEKALKYIVLYFLVPLAGPICLVKCMDKGYESAEEAVACEPCQIPDEIEVIAETSETEDKTEE